MRRFLISLSLLTMSLVGAQTLVSQAPVYAQETPRIVDCNTVAGGVLGIPSWSEYLECDANNNNAIANFTFPQDVVLIALAVFEILTRVAVYIAVGVIIYAGFKFTIAQGNPEKISEAKTIIQDALIGLVIALLATAIIVFLGGSIS